MVFMKKLFVITPATLNIEKYAGVQKFIFELIRSLHHTYEISIISPNKVKNKKTLIFFRKNGAKPIYKKFFPIQRLNNLEYSIPLSEGYVYVTSFITSVFQPLFSKNVILGTHTFFNPREEKGGFGFSEIRRLKVLLFQFLSKLFYIHRTDIKVHCLNSWQVSWFKKLGYKNVYLIQNFLDTKKYSKPQPVDKFTVLFLARHRAIQKGVDTLLEIVKILRNHEEIEIIACGVLGKEFASLQRKIKNFKWLGFVSEKEKITLLSKSSLFLAPSRFEGNPISVLEALVSGCPFLGSNIIAFEDILRLDREFGWIVKEYKPENFANKILEIYAKWKSNKRKYFETRKYIAKKSRELFDVKKVMKNFEEYLLDGEV